MENQLPQPWYSRLPLGQYVLAALAVVVVAALAELAMGRAPFSQSGQVRIWVGAVNSAENSQQLIDWYSITHVLHGFLCYGLLHLVGRGRWPIGLTLFLAVCLEATWEVLENTPWVIDRYRTTTIACDYYGDSVLNSVSDILFCLLGFVLAAWLPAWATVTLFVAFELGLAYAIHDNLTLNVIMLICPLESIKQWQTSLG